MAEIWGAVIAGGAALAGAGISASSSRSAARGQQGAADAASAEQARQYDLARADQAPWRDAGTNALSRLNTLSGQFGQAPTSADVMGQPGYQFGLNQGLDAIEGRAAAQGGLYSGAAGQALTRYGNDYATTKYADAFNQRRLSEGDIWNRYAGLAGIGQTATNQLASMGQNYANNVGNIGMNNANAQGAATIAQGNALQGALNQGVSWWNNRPQQQATPGGGYVSPGYTSQGWGGQTYDPSTGTTLFADGGPVQKYAMGGEVCDCGPNTKPGAELPIGAAQTVQPQAQPLTQPTYQGDWNPEQSGQSFDQWQASTFPQPMQQQPGRAWFNTPNQLQAFADGGRVEPKIGTRAPPRMGGTGGGMSPNALLLLLQAQEAQQMQPQVGALDPRIALEMRARQAGLAEGGQVAGPGGPRDDMVPAMLSNGEHVIDAASVNAVGGGNNAAGQQKLNALRSMLKGR